MRRSFTVSVLLPAAISLLALLWLLWGFFPLPVLAKGALSLLMTAVAAAVIGRLRRQHKAAAKSEALFFQEEQHGPIVLVCGEGLEALFGDKPERVTSQGYWQRTGDIEAMRMRVEQIWRLCPDRVGRLSVMYCVLPDALHDEEALKAQLKALRQQLHALAELTGFRLPLILHCQFSGPATPWVIVCGSEAVVNDDNDGLVALDVWQRQGDNLLRMPAIAQAFAFIRHTLLETLRQPDRLSPQQEPVAVVFRTGAPGAASPSLWRHWLQRQTAMRFSDASPEALRSDAFVDPLLAMLAPFVAPAPRGKIARRLILVLLFCALTALAFSVHNNRKLTEQTGFALRRWHAIPMTRYEPKAEALNALKQEALLLERWHRQGEPLRYGLGLYSGARLWLALQRAIDSYVPPPKPEPKPAPKTVRLDSMSLFDSGKAALKSGSTKLLVNALVGIKARPGVLIVVSGHTDDTGNPTLNQKLSLKRAEAVRDWMRDTGDVPESCFAVQGYGESRPLAANDTAEGRALNRRVEISLVPQADACRVPGVTSPSSQDDDGS